MTFQLKATMSPEFIMDREEKMWAKARKRLDNCQTIMIIGTLEQLRLVYT